LVELVFRVLIAEDCTVKINNLFTMALALCTIIPSAYAQKNWNAPHIVTTDCSGCHGIDGNSQQPDFPKLASLDAKYAEKKLREFKEPNSPAVDEMFPVLLRFAGAKTNVTRQERVNMEGMAHAAKPEVIKEAADWYAKQPPAPGHSGNKALIEEGKDLFMNGLPAQKVLACTTCHGTNAEGKGVAPRLAGQNAEYIEGQLAKFGSGDRQHAPEMTMVTRDLNPQQARAAAAYLQSR